MWKIPIVASLPAILVVFASGGDIVSAVRAEWTSAGFLKLPSSAEVGAMSAVAVDRAHGFLYVLHRGGTPLLQFDAKGNYLGGWGHGEFKVPHGLRIDAAGN